MPSLRIRRALLTVSDKEGLVDLGKALNDAGAELVATGRTAMILKDAGLPITPIEKVSGSPEAFQGRMKTLSFPVCSGILYRRGDSSDEADLKRLGVVPIDCVVVNFYPFEAALAKPGIQRRELVEEIDIGGPTLVRAAAKNAPDVLVLTDPTQYTQVIQELKRDKAVKEETALACASTAWERILSYDSAIVREFGARGKRMLRYGENPHQRGFLEFDPDGPIGWGDSLTSTELSYNNILDLTAAYLLASDLHALDSRSTGVVIIKHNNPCGVTMIPKTQPGAQKEALIKAWEGDPVSAFGGVLVFTDPIEADTATWLADRFVELVAAPKLAADNASLKTMLAKRKNLKAVPIRKFGQAPQESMVVVPGGRLFQTTDLNLGESLTSVTRKKWPEEKMTLAHFGIAICRSLKSNAITLVRGLKSGGFQLVGAGQGQPNRVDALRVLAVPRAKTVLSASAETGSLEDCVMVSDAFFPFRDTVDAAAKAGIRYIVQPGGSIKDGDSIAACDEHGVAMVFTGIRHFRH